jgi:hypothetical protein
MDKELERFKSCAEAYGANPRRWPEADRPLHARLALTHEGTAILAEAERTDLFLDVWTAAPARAVLAERILDAATEPAPPRRRRGLAWSTAAFAASAVFGFVIGFTQVQDEPSSELVSQVLVGPAGLPRIGL